MIPAELERADIAGATVAVVKDGVVLFAKGYGDADIETGKPVVAETTLFRPGSVSKLIVWTAVMQLVEEGRLDLDNGRKCLPRFPCPRDLSAADHVASRDDGHSRSLRRRREQAAAAW